MALTPEQEILGVTPEVSDLSRQKKIAELLMSQGLDQPQGQMISGYYVAPSWSQQLNPLFKAAVGTESAKSADKKELELAAALRGQKGEALAKFQQLMANPETRAQGMQFAAGNQFLQPLAAKLAEGMKLGEGEKFVMPGMNGQSIEVASGGQKYHAPIQIDTGTAIELRDPLDPTKVLSRMPKSQMPTAGQVVETENGPMLVNTRTGQAQPIMAGGQAVAGGKPLTESQGNATAYGIRAKQANAIATGLEEKGVTDTGLTRASVAGAVGGTPFIGKNLENTANTLLNWTASPQQQQTKQARQNFITAVLRKESGAAISPQEFQVEEEKYFPKINDSQETIKQKQQARELAIKALEIQAGPGARQIKSVGGDAGVVDFNSLPKRN